MNGPSVYETLRHFADSWGLAAMVLVFVLLCGWPLRPGARGANDRAARMIFDDDGDRGADNGQD